MPKILDEKFNYASDVLMPGEEGNHTLDIKTEENKPTIVALANGTLPVRILITCTDVFGTPYSIEQEIRKVGNVYRMTEYLPKGLN